MLRIFWVALVLVLALASASARELPNLFYGTAWKKQNTTALVAQAIELGFPAIDTANQLAHYEEALVGDALINSNVYYYVQTKFSFKEFQYDATNLPFTDGAPLAQQVRESFESSLQHLKVARIDSFLLHGPLLHGTGELGERDIEAWRAMEALIASSSSPDMTLGICNCNAQQLDHLVRTVARIKPTMLQVRCVVTDAWSESLRAKASELGIKLQCYSVLRGANKRVLKHPSVLHIAHSRGMTPAQVVVRFVHQHFDGAQILIGPSNMTQAKEVYDAMFSSGMELTAEELARIERIANEDDDRVQVWFANRYTSEVVLLVYWWSTETDNKQLQLTVHPGQQLAIHTFHDHAFHVTIAEGGEVLKERDVINAQHGRVQHREFGQEEEEEEDEL